MIRGVEFLQAQPAQMRNQTAAAIVLEIEDGAIASNERIDIGDV